MESLRNFERACKNVCKFLTICTCTGIIIYTIYFLLLILLAIGGGILVAGLFVFNRYGGEILIIIDDTARFLGDIYNFGAEVWNEFALIIPDFALLWNYIMYFLWEIISFFIEIVCLNPKPENIFTDCELLVLLINTIKDTIKAIWNTIKEIVNFILDIFLDLFKNIICYVDIWKIYCTFDAGVPSLSLIGLLRWIFWLLSTIVGLFFYCLSVLIALLFDLAGSAVYMGIIGAGFDPNNRMYMRLVADVIFGNPIYVANAFVRVFQHYVLSVFDLLVCTVYGTFVSNPLCLARMVCDAIFSNRKNWVIDILWNWICKPLGSCPCNALGYFPGVFFNVPCIPPQYCNCNAGILTCGLGIVSSQCQTDTFNYLAVRGLPIYLETSYAGCRPYLPS